MFNSGFQPSIDGTEYIYEYKENKGLPLMYSYLKQLPAVLNQYDDPICIPCSMSAWLNWKTNIILGKKTDNSIDVMQIYREGNGQKDGMTCKDAFKYLINNGVDSKVGKLKISKYFSVNSILALRYAIVANGPCLAVLPVYNPDKDKFWLGSNLQGYHAVSVIGYDPDGFIIRNSWGEGYGFDGYSYITSDEIMKSKEIWTFC